MRRSWLFGVGGLALVAAVFMLMSAGVAGAVPLVDVQHGIGFTKGCGSPTHVGAAYTCTYSVRNVVDEAQDTLTVTGLNDTVLTAGGPVSSGNVMTSLKFEIGPFLPGFSNAPT